jgi:hypothetical protein
MQLEYTPTEEDLVALARHQIAVSPVMQQRLQRTHLAYVIGFSLLAVGTYFVLPNELLSIAFAAFASIALFAYPFFSRWRLQRSLPEAVRRSVTPTSYAARSLLALPDGLEQVADEAHSKITWRALDAVFETARYTYLSVDGTYTIVIPRERVPSIQYREFMDEVREYRMAAFRQPSTVS